MAVAILFDIPGARRSQYDAVIRKLQDAGEGAPPGRLYHVVGANTGWLARRRCMGLAEAL